MGTTNYNFNKPTYGTRNWDIPLNENWDDVDALIKEKSDEFNSMFINVKYPPIGYTPVKGDGITDDTTALKAIFMYAFTHKPCKIFFPKGTYLFTDLGNIACSSLTIEGENDSSTILKCISDVADHTAILINAFDPDLSSTPYCQRFNIKNITVEGNAKTKYGYNMQGLARCTWENVFFRNGKSEDGIAFLMKGVQLCNFKSVMCSAHVTPMSSIPYYGLYLTNGVRNGVSIGSCCNNVFESIYMEDTAIGYNLVSAETNVFISGSAESNTVAGMIVSGSCKGNVFITTCFESVIASFDIEDSGINTTYIGCSCVYKMILKGRRIRLDGGWFNSVEIITGATKNQLNNITYNYYGATGTITDNGTGTQMNSVFDQRNNSYNYGLRGRNTLPVTSSPFIFTNEYGMYGEVVIQSGTLTSVTITRNGLSFQVANITPMQYLLAPTDIITVTYTGSNPSISWLPQNGL
jgi:hypothetical protein